MTAVEGSGPDSSGETACGWWVGPIWKLDGETCVCKLNADHRRPHECTCGAWFEGCGHPPEHRRSEAAK